MTKWQVFVTGVFVGLVAMQAGHGLFFRNPDYLAAIAVTVVVYGMAMAIASNFD